MKNIMTVLFFLLLFVSCDKIEHTDYITLCRYYYHNKTSKKLKLIYTLYNRSKVKDINSKSKNNIKNIVRGQNNFAPPSKYFNKHVFSHFKIVFEDDKTLHYKSEDKETKTPFVDKFYTKISDREWQYTITEEDYKKAE